VEAEQQRDADFLVCGLTIEAPFLQGGSFLSGTRPQRRLLDWAQPNAGALQRRRQGSLPACSPVADPFWDHIKLSPYGTAFGRSRSGMSGPASRGRMRVTPNTVVRGGYGIITFDR